MSSLDVYLSGNRVGELTRKPNGTMRFRYEDAYDGPPLSHAMPLQKEAHPHAVCHAVLGGLLPEGMEREVIAGRLGVSAGNDFALLEAIGGDCAGAIAVLPQGHSRGDEVVIVRLSETEFDAMIGELPQRPLATDPEGGVRLSLAGAQPKVPVVYDDKGFGLPASPAAVSTHIVKPEPVRFPGLVDNEAFCLDLANASGLPVARADKRSTADGTPYLIVERFDRDRTVTPPVRVHQEDFCQALAVAAGVKYQEDGGPGLKESAQLIREACAVPATDLPAFWRAVAFNWLVGNCDAHAKNYSLLYLDSGPVLAPLYDLVSTRFYGDLSTRFAMRVGSARSIGEIDLAAWRKAAESIGLEPGFAIDEVREVFGRVRSAVAGVAARPEHDNEAAAFVAQYVTATKLR